MTTSSASHAGQTTEQEPVHYGWRYVERIGEDGATWIEQIPLTIEDVLHPQEGDQVTHSTDHQRFCTYLVNVLEAHLAADQTAVVLSDVRVAWDVPEVKAHGPDIAVIFGVRERKTWSTFDVAVEGTRPALIIEVTSPETRAIDLTSKVDEYEQVGVAYYIIIESYSRRGTVGRRLRGYRLTPTGYAVIAPDERGRLWLEPVELWLGLEANEVVCYNNQGRQLRDYTGEVTARIEAEQRAAEAESRAAEQARARAEAESRAAEQTRARAEAESRAADVEQRLRALEEELRRMRGSG